MSKVINKRSELLFCYDIADANPNGDPQDENKPRIDEETSINIVTDVRLKRTIRDYLKDYMGHDGEKDKDIFVREIMTEVGIQDGKTRAGNFKNSADEILKTCIDVRLFGGVIPLDKDSITFTGPVQFKMGRSLHPVELKHIKGTGAFASKTGTKDKPVKHKTFREEYMLPYSFITFYGIVNENAAQHTEMTEDDLHNMLTAMWLGTKNLISRSKFGQMPRFLLKVNYKNNGFFIGDLDKKIEIAGADNLLKIRSTKDFSLDISKLLTALNDWKNEIESIEYCKDPSLTVVSDIPDNWQELKL